MYKGIYTISKVKVLRNTPEKRFFYKNYSVFDGLGTLYFETLLEARKHARQKSILTENTLKYALKLYPEISSLYVNRLFEYRNKKHLTSIVNEQLISVLLNLEYLSSKRKEVYMLAKIKHVLDSYLNICNMLNISILYRQIRIKYDELFPVYPEFRSSDYRVNKMNIKQLKTKAV